MLDFKTNYKLFYVVVKIARHSFSKGPNPYFLTHYVEFVIFVSCIEN
jgi:hypothetical protein